MSQRRDQAGSLVSCIIPVFNGERYLREALDSILAQTYRPLEIIVVDDGSTDGTKDLVTSYGDRICYLWQSNSGAASALNLGLDMVKGNFVAFLDADDLWHPEKLTRQMARFYSCAELDLCVSHVQNFWIPELAEEGKQFQDHPRSKSLPGYVTQSLMARSNLFKQIGLFNTSLKHSYHSEWFMRCQEKGAVMELLPDVLVYRRLHSTNLSRQKNSESMREYLRLLKASLDRRRRGEDSAESNISPISED